jgi:hypothetical protein
MAPIGGICRSRMKDEQMFAVEEDLPAAYLYFAIAAIIVIAVTAVGAFVLLIRN